MRRRHAQPTCDAPGCMDIGALRQRVQELRTAVERRLLSPAYSSLAQPLTSQPYGSSAADGDDEFRPAPECAPFPLPPQRPVRPPSFGC